MRNEKLKNLTLLPIMTALICIASLIAIPVPFTTVPFTLQTLMIMLVGLLLSPLQALIAVGLYLLLGAIGLPVFAGGAGGLNILVGPTGGFLFGFAVGAMVISLLKGKEVNFPRMLGATIVGGMIVVYLMGAPWLGQAYSMSLTKSFAVGVLPFIPLDAVKAFLAVSIAYQLRRQLKALGYIA